MAKAENKEGWEVSEFPILCETCLGDNPYVRMTRLNYGDECKVCTRPFTIFRWCPGAQMRFKKTIVCQSCAKFKNVCQTCLLDLQYNLPVQVRDSLLKLESSIPKSEINRKFMNQNVEAKLAQGETLVDYAKADPVGHELLKSIARNEPRYKRNLPHVCSFFVKGTCNRGDACPYRHELDAKDEQLSNQKIKDRYLGVNDPVAAKLLDKIPKNNDLTPPEDKTVTTLAILGVDETVKEQKLRDYFYAFGEIADVKVIPLSRVAFVRYSMRDAAELAMRKCLSGVMLDATPLKVAWARPKKQAVGSSSARQPVRRSTGAHRNAPDSKKRLLFAEDAESEPTQEDQEHEHEHEQEQEQEHEQEHKEMEPELEFESSTLADQTVDTKRQKH